MKLISNKPKALSLAIAGAVTMSLFGSSGAYAQRAIEEVVVTAERREATEQTTSISMEVFTQDMLSTNNIAELQDLQDAMPGIQIQNNGIGNDINIRGVGNSVYSPQVQMGVQVVNDGLTHGEPMGLNGMFFDVGTVEVLRGPQGTFIGQSAAGGAILINSASPDFDGVHGYVEGKMGNYQHNAVSGAINLPWSDTLAARIAFNTEDRESYYKNLGSQFSAHGGDQSKPGSLENRQVRLGVLWEPNQRFSALFKVEQNFVDNDGGVRKPKRLPTTGVIVGDHDSDPLTPDQPYEVTTYSQYREYSPAEPFDIYKLWHGSNFQENQQYSLRLDYELANGMAVKSLTGYNRLMVIEDYRDRTQPGGVPLWPDRFLLGPDNRSWTQEVTLESPEGPTNWIVGVFHQERNTPVKGSNPGGQFNDGCGWQYNGEHISCTDLEDPDYYDHTLLPAYVENDAIFGQFNYAITDELELAVGARWNMDWSGRDFTSVREGVNLSAGGAPGSPQAGATAATCAEYGLTGRRLQSPQIRSGDSLPGVAPQPDQWECFVRINSVGLSTDDFDVDTDVPTYKIGLNWAPTDTDYFYAFYARGYKAATSQGQGVEPELIDDYEFGWKGTLFDGQLSGDIGFYYMDYSDMQQSAFTANDPLGADQANTNIGDATLMGVEGSFQTYIGNLGINGSFSFADSEVEDARTLNSDLLPAWAEHETAVNQLDYLPDCSLVAGTPTPSTGFVAGSTTQPNGNCFDYSPYWLDFSGQQQITSPDVSYNLGVDYQFALGGGTLTPRLSFSHTDENYSDLIQTPYYLNDARDLTNFSVSYERDDWTIQAYVTNVSDDTYVASAREHMVLYGDPRTYGVRARMNF